MSASLRVAGALLVAAVVYHPPVQAPVADRFRPPPAPYASGNRGLEYAARPGAPVQAAAPGVVAFAGKVGRSFAVSVVHADGLRTTYTHLQSITVRRGARVAAGDEVGRAVARLHFGARAGDAYLDPEALFARRHARLVE